VITLAFPMAPEIVASNIAVDRKSTRPVMMMVLSTQTAWTVFASSPVATSLETTGGFERLKSQFQSRSTQS
jgi:hypothetical protein